MTNLVTVGEIEDVLRDARNGGAVEIHRGVMKHPAGDVPIILESDVFCRGPGVERGLDPDPEISVCGVRRAHRGMAETSIWPQVRLTPPTTLQLAKLLNVMFPLTIVGLGVIGTA